MDDSVVCTDVPSTLESRIPMVDRDGCYYYYTTVVVVALGCSSC
jgi:hypothetical protein